MDVYEFISRAPDERQDLLAALHEGIIANDPVVIPAVKPLMGKQAILYEERWYMKYGLAGAKNHLSFHCLPMYMKPELHQKFEKLLPGASFQKGCINFKTAAELPVIKFTQLVVECSKINIADVLEKRKK